VDTAMDLIDASLAEIDCAVSPQSPPWVRQSPRMFRTETPS